MYVVTSTHKLIPSISSHYPVLVLCWRHSPLHNFPSPPGGSRGHSQARWDISSLQLFFWCYLGVSYRLDMPWKTFKEKATPRQEASWSDARTTSTCSFWHKGAAALTPSSLRMSQLLTLFLRVRWGVVFDSRGHECSPWLYFLLRFRVSTKAIDFRLIKLKPENNLKIFLPFPHSYTFSFNVRRCLVISVALFH